MNETLVTMTGNVVDQPVRRTTAAGVPFVTFRLASTVRHLDPGSGRYADAGTSFVNVSAFRRLGVNADTSLRRGQPVIVYGRLRVQRWSSGERSGTSVDIDAHAIGHDLNRGVATFQRTSLLEQHQPPTAEQPERGLDDEAAAEVPAVTPEPAEGCVVTAT